MRLENSVRYVGFAASAAALLWLAHAGIMPTPNPLRPGEYIIDTSAHPPRTLRNFFRREDVIVALTWVFATSGASLTLPNDFNTTSNQVNGIGSGGSATGGAPAPNCFFPGAGGNGAGGGAFAQIVNYNGHNAGQSVNIQVGASDTWFDSSVILLAKAASGSTGGQAASCVGTTKFSGGNGAINPMCACVLTTGGGGGGGAGGPHGAGANGANGGGGFIPPNGGGGGTGDNGNTAAQANGTQFDASHGSGGGGNGGSVGACGGPGSSGHNGGFYGAGAGGGGGGSPPNGGGGAPGASTQGLIGISYQPTVGTSQAFFIW